jgi:acyl CoA:acetate/3-ketoacid CoA transferase alpha subunit
MFKVEPQEGPSRVMTAENAVKKFVRPGMALHTLITHAFPYALINEVTRQFWKKDPKFTLLALGAVNQALVFLRGGMLERIVSSYCGDVYPAPGPNPNFNQAYLDGQVQIENWTVLTFSQRMLAGALGIPGIPTRSLAGSTMAEDNRDSYGCTGGWPTPPATCCSARRSPRTSGGRWEPGRGRWCRWRRSSTPTSSAPTPT